MPLVSSAKLVVSIIGFHRSLMGLGEDARTLAEALLYLGLEPELVDVSPELLEPYDDLTRFRPYEAATPTGAIVIFCLPPFEMMRAISLLGLSFRDRKRRAIGYWAWETTALPASWHFAYDHVDEVWASSTFLRDVYRGETSKPVRHVPLRVSVAEPRLSADVAQLFDGRFTIIGVFDFHSRIERKNPFGAIAAFQLAFPRGTERAQLILKTINGPRRAADLARVLAACYSDPRIAVVDGAVDRAGLCGMIEASDVYLSLHRSEGFGRPVAEAMLLGTPVVATRWSGTADFLDDVTGYPVRSRLRPVRSDEYPHAAGLWAEPDVEQAAAYLATLHAEPRSRGRKSEQARLRIANLFGREAVCAALAAALSPHGAAPWRSIG